MDLRKVCLSATGFFLIAVSIGSCYAVDGNAVGGSAYSEQPGGPLEDVQVSVAQNRTIRDSTRKEDGNYTLKVPSTIVEFDLLYQKTGYLDSHDLNIKNDHDQQKRPVARNDRQNQYWNAFSQRTAKVGRHLD